MSKISSMRYGLFLIVIIGVMGGVALAKGGFFVDRYEADVAHLLDILLRIDAGLVPHIDISTPLGIAAFYPITLFSALGLGYGQSFIAAQILIAGLLAPMVTRVAVSRLNGMSAWVFGLVVMTIVLSLVHGEDVASTSASMYYNRWAWAMSFVALFLAAMPAQDGSDRPRLDGLIIGVLLAGLALLKPTYFIAFVLPISAALALRGAWMSLLFGLVSGCVVALMVAWGFGVDFYLAYIHDLLTVAQSPTRAAPSADFAEVLNGPRFLIGTLVLVLSIIVLRQGRQGRAGLVLLLLAPGFIYVTYQNFGNDPKWLLFLCVFLLAHRPTRGTRVIFNADARNASAALALVSFALIAPSFQNMITSPMRHFGEVEEGYAMLFKTAPKAHDVFVFADRVSQITETRPMALRVPALAIYGAPLSEPMTFQGAELPRCTLDSGQGPLDTYMAQTLRGAPYGFGSLTQVFVTDLVSSIWIEGGFAPLKGGAPWYYSGLPGIENADVIVVPVCPRDALVRRETLAAIEQADLTLGAPIKNDVMWVYPIKKAGE
ncbi:hypothetical protein [Pacificibacter marinus]|uniref:hypothetical protein n=1 Tax=Pacificibacter marinus TaxID=658057 RepID=UPI001C072B21|nr:hypothetical protein [Pacificibacter marinus]MBU2865584.1 hypothetical protein [Pacificibacter marinus]